MKKIKYFILILISFVIMNNQVFADSVSTCKEYDEPPKRINALNGARGEYNYKSCYSVICHSGVYNRYPYSPESGYSCNNGNTKPYTSVVTDTCKEYLKTCNTTNIQYCVMETYVDCQRKSDGSPFVSQDNPVTTPTSTKPTTTTTTTTKKPTTTTTIKSTTTTEYKSANNNIKSIYIDDTELKIDNNKNNYSIKVPYDVSNLNVKVVTEDEKAKVTITGDKDIPNEDSNILITIKAENGNEKIVTIQVKRFNGENNDCTLSNITIANYPIEFNKNGFNYILKLPKNITSLDIDVVPTDKEHAVYEINGNKKLKNRSKVQIAVVAQDGTVCTYTIKIKKSSNAWKYVLLIFLLVGGLGASVYLLLKFLRKSKGKYKYE